MDLEAVADELYAAAPEEFVPLRTERVKAARTAGDRALATAIGGLRKPTRSAWLVNLLARGAADELSGLLDLGAALRDAQRSLAGPDLRRLSAERHRAVDALARRAAELGAAEGYTAPDGAQQEVAQTLQAALADEGLGEQVRRGTVAAAVTSAGFGPFEVGWAKPVTAGRTQPKAPAGRSPGRRTPATPDQDAARRAAEERLEAARQAEDAARAELADGEAAAEEATRRADELADRADELRTELAAVEADEQQARRDARTARKALDRLQQRAEAASDALDRSRADAEGDPAD